MLTVQGLIDYLQKLPNKDVGIKIEDVTGVGTDSGRGKFSNIRLSKTHWNHEGFYSLTIDSDGHN